MPPWTYTADIEGKERFTPLERGGGAGFPEEGGLNQLIEDNNDVHMGKVRWEVGWGVAFLTKNDTLAWDSCQGSLQRV